MGDYVTVSCPSCNWHINGMLGMGMMSELDWDTACALSSSSRQENIQRKLDIAGANALWVSYEQVIVACENCNNWGFRENYKVTHDTGKITPSFKCSKCNCKMLPLSDEIFNSDDGAEQGQEVLSPLDDFITKKAKCPKCQRSGLEKENSGLWD